MMDLDERIELLRNKMTKMFELKGSLTDPSVIEMSQRLDEYILEKQINQMQSSELLNRLSCDRLDQKTPL